MVAFTDDAYVRAVREAFRRSAEDDEKHGRSHAKLLDVRVTGPREDRTVEALIELPSGRRGVVDERVAEGDPGSLSMLLLVYAMEAHAMFPPQPQAPDEVAPPDNGGDPGIE